MFTTMSMKTVAPVRSLLPTRALSSSSRFSLLNFYVPNIVECPRFFLWGSKINEKIVLTKTLVYSSIFVHSSRPLDRVGE